MKAGDLVEMYGGPVGFYGILLRRTDSEFPGKWWTVLWQSGYLFDRNENLMKVIT